MQYNLINEKKWITIGALLLILLGCKKFVKVDAPDTMTTADIVYNLDATATSVLTGLYTNISLPDYASGGFRNLEMYAGLSADELTLWSGNTNIGQTQFYMNSLVSTSTGFVPWNNLYPYIFTCNTAIDGLTGSTRLTPGVKRQLLGESKFMRALFYFYLVNLYGDVPLILSTDYRATAKLSRTPKAQIYQQIIVDLKDAQGLLNIGYTKADALTTYPDASAERVRPNIGAATALLARVYLFTNDYVNAEAEASTVIANTALYNLNTLDGAFLKNNPEAIWQLQPVNKGWNTEDARLFIIPTTGLSTSNPVYLSSNLLNKFETNDKRRINWVGTYSNTTGTYNYAFKYKSASLNANVTEYQMVLRLAEQYLIRAEARAQQGNISGSKADINMIRTRAGLPNTMADDKASLLTAVARERQVELFTEWGHRWFDLKRTGTVDSVMSIFTAQKGGNWKPDWALYPIPLSDIQKDPNLVQNTGY